MARKESCAGTTFGIAVDDIRACCEEPAAMRVVEWVTALRHTYDGGETRRRRINSNKQQQAVAGDYLYAMFIDSRFTTSRSWRSDSRVTSGCRGGDRDRVQPTSQTAAHIAGFLQLPNHVLEAASVRPLSSLHTSPPIQLHPYLGTTADIVLRFGQFQYRLTSRAGRSKARCTGAHTKH
jgi:hypothetical protein